MSPGPPLVFVHGALDDSSIWQPQLDSLQDEFTVFAWDEPEARPGFRLADYADALAALIEELGLAPANVCGLSWGGTVVLELYRRRARLVASLILADTYAGWKGSLPAEEVEARVASVRPLAVENPALARQLAIMAEADLRDVLPTIAVPTLLIWGEDDERSPLRVAHQFQAAIPHAELVVIPGAGHISNVDRPAEFNRAVREFCIGSRP